MAKRIIIAEELEAILQVLKSFPDGAFIEEIEIGLKQDPERRTLQRRLSKLLKAGLISVSGQSRATRYHGPDGDVFKPKDEYSLEVAADRSSDEVRDDADGYGFAKKQDKLIPAGFELPLSDKGKEIMSLVRGSLQSRRPVGYNRGFLDAYHPNRTSYLNRAELEKLAEIGRTAMPDQPAGTYAKEILNRLLIDLSWNSSRLEGNTYSLLDTQRLISFGEEADNKSVTEAQMILNHKDAIEFLVESAEDVEFNRYSVCNLHAMLSNNLMPDPGASGRLRSFAVGIHRSVYEPLAMPQMISEVFDLILEKAGKINDPFEQAFFVMVHLPYLQPFDDVNKRVSRLAANIPFVRHNLAPLSFVDVPNEIYIQGILGVYELNRIELLKDVFLWAYERSAIRYSALRQSLGEPDPFRLKYRAAIYESVETIVSKALTPKEASAQIRKMANDLTEKDQEKFIEAVDYELLSLREGNIARYRIRPSVFRQWKELWSQHQ